MRIIILIGLTLTSLNVYAYVGPGLGLGVLGALFGAIVALLLALFGVVWYPLKRLMKKKKAEERKSEEGTPKEQERQRKDKVDQRHAE